MSFPDLSSSPECLLDELHVVDLMSRSWIRTVTVAPRPTAQPVLLYGHRSIARVKEVNGCVVARLTIIGGGANCFSFGTAFNLFPMSLEFTLL